MSTLTVPGEMVPVALQARRPSCTAQRAERRARSCGGIGRETGSTNVE